MQICFLPNNITIEAQAGESLLEVANRAGLDVPTGCLSGSCHACEMEIVGMGEVCSCITAVPDGHDRLTIQLFSDPSW